MSIRNGFVKRAMEFGYTEGEAIDIFNKAASVLPNMSGLSNSNQRAVTQGVIASNTDQFSNQGVRDELHNKAMSLLPGGNAIAPRVTPPTPAPPSLIAPSMEALKLHPNYNK